MENIHTKPLPASTRNLYAHVTCLIGCCEHYFLEDGVECLGGTEGILEMRIIAWRMTMVNLNVVKISADFSVCNDYKG